MAVAAIQPAQLTFGRGNAVPDNALSIAKPSKFVELFEAPFGTTKPLFRFEKLWSHKAKEFIRRSNILSYFLVRKDVPIWTFVHRPNAQGGVHSLTIIDDQGENGQPQKKVLLLVTKRPPFGDRLILELPAGLVGDINSNESPLTASDREVKEETGYDVKHSSMLSNSQFPPSTGISTEQTYFTLSHATGQPNRNGLEEAEKSIIIDSMEVPLDVFVNHKKFTQWLDKMQEESYIVSMPVLAARGLMPPNVNRTLDAVA